MLGPGSDELKLLINILRQADPQNVTEYMNLIRRKLVAEQKGDTRKESDVELALNRTERLHDRILVQRYICGELDYQGRKFDLRVYYLVASVDVSSFSFHIKELVLFTVLPCLLAYPYILSICLVLVTAACGLCSRWISSRIATCL